MSGEALHLIDKVLLMTATGKINDGHSHSHSHSHGHNHIHDKKVTDNNHNNNNNNGHHHHYDLLPLVAACYDLGNRAGLIISKIFESGDLGVVDKGHDDKKLTGADQAKALDPQTAADRRAQKLIVGSLHKKFPYISILGEEGESGPGTKDKEEEEEEEKDSNDTNKILIDPSTTLPVTIDRKNIPDHYFHMNADDLVIWVDPLDGTKEYTEGIKEAVTCLIGISYKGRPIAGVINRPFVNQTVWGIIDVGAFGLRTSVDYSKRDTKRRVCTTTRSHGGKTIEEYLTLVKPDNVIRAGGAGGKVLMILEGEADAYIFPSIGTKKWDTCAPEAVLFAAKGYCTEPDGKTLLRYEKGESVHNSKGFIATWCGGDYHQSFCNVIKQ